MECDHLAANGLYLLTRVGNGESMLVWKIRQYGGVEEDPVGEVEFDEDERREQAKSIGFEMKGGMSANPEGEETEELVMMNRYVSHVKFNRLKQQMMKRM